jgi:diacylglycerol kinase (ATP)
MTNKPNGTGLGRIIKAYKCSMQGFSAAFKHESAFRQELLLAAILLPISFLVATTGVQLALLIAALIIVLLAEIVNSAIEAVVDRVGLEHHELSGRAKDMGSSAVFLALTLCAVIWAGVIYDVFIATGALSDLLKF